MTTQPAVVLAGTGPEPLASYLKAIGVLRLVSEQLDRDVEGAWRPDGFGLYSRALDADRLMAFLAEAYVPTPIVAPWNGDSGFFASGNHDGIDVLRREESPRLVHYRAAIAACDEVLRVSGLREKPEKEHKPGLVARLRAELPDAAVEWLDAAVILSDGDLRFPPMLGTGGNDGRLDFSNNQMQRIVELLGTTGERRIALARGALLGEPIPGLDKGVAIGQFSPAAAGGPNTTAGFDRDSLVNPWDYVLLLEGALAFVSAVSRRDEADPGSVAFPFMVAASGAGYASSARADADETRDELWLPIWSHRASYRELRQLFGEGRAKVGRQAARTGVDFARAVASLGVDRGIDRFVRYGFHVRNGLSYFATPLGDYATEQRPEISYLRDLDAGDWLDRVRSHAANRLASASVRRAASRLDAAVLAACRWGRADSYLALVAALGDLEAAVAVSPAARERIRPVPRLRPEWAAVVDDGSAEVRLAAALAAGGLRRYLVPIDPAAPWRWRDTDTRQVVWGPGDLISNLEAMLRRRELEQRADGSDGTSSPVRVAARLADLGAFIDGRVDDTRIAELARGLALIDWPPRIATRSGVDPGVPAAFVLLHLVHTRALGSGVALPPTPGMIARAFAGDLPASLRLAIRRLRSAGLAPRCAPMVAPRARSRRIVAALAFPISKADRSAVAERALEPMTTEEDTSHVDATS